MTVLAIASFDDAELFRAAIGRLHADRRAILGLWSPMPVDVPHEDAGGARGIAGIMAASGLVGVALFYLLSWWTATRAYPFDSGGRPTNSWPAFLVAPIEFGALVAGIAGVVLLLIRARLTRLHDAAFDIEEVGDAMRDRFVIAVRCDSGDDAGHLLLLLAAAGAVHNRLVEE